MVAQVQELRRKAQLCRRAARIPSFRILEHRSHPCGVGRTARARCSAPRAAIARGRTSASSRIGPWGALIRRRVEFCPTPTGPTFPQTCLYAEAAPLVESPGSFVAGRARHRWRRHRLAVFAVDCRSAARLAAFSTAEKERTVNRPRSLSLSDRR